MKRITKSGIAVLASLTPFVALAAGMDFKGLVKFIIDSFLTPAATLTLSAAVVFFLWNIMQVVRNSDNPKELETFKTKAVWGIVGIAVMVSLWGLVNFVTSSAKLDTTTVPVPTLPNSFN